MRPVNWNAEQYFKSDAGEFSALALAYLEGAIALEKERLKKGNVLSAPILALSSHGLELILKACFFLNEIAPPTRGPDGHNSLALWNSTIAAPLRERVVINAGIAAKIDQNNPAYRGVPSPDEASTLMADYAVELCKLNATRGYPLRYPPPEEIMVPRTPLLVKALWRTADDLVRWPWEFKLNA